MKALLALNTIALLAALYLAFVSPTFADLAVSLRYVELDRAGAINEEVLANPAIFHPSYGFSENQRNTVPRFVARPALDGQRFNAFLLLGLALVNLAVVLFIRKTTGPRCQTHGATSPGQPQSPPVEDRTTPPSR